MAAAPPPAAPKTVISSPHSGRWVADTIPQGSSATATGASGFRLQATPAGGSNAVVSYERLLPNVDYALRFDFKRDAAHGLPDSETTLAQSLRDVGYYNAAIGKWHLGFRNESLTPTYRGYDTFLVSSERMNLNALSHTASYKGLLSHGRRLLHPPAEH